MYLSVISAVFGIILVFLGIAGFIPALYTKGLLLGVFDVDTVQNIFNFVVGFIAIVSALKYKRDRMFFQIFGVVFAILGIAGLVMQGDLLITHVNMADTLMDIVLGAIFLILGFSSNKTGRV